MTLTQNLVAEIERLRAATATGIDVASADQADQLASSVAPDDLPAVQETVAGHLPERGVHPGLHYLLARLSARRGEREEAHEIFGRILERLNQTGEFDALARLVTRAPDLATCDQAVPLLVRAFRETDGRAVPIELISDWSERCPADPRLDWLAGLACLAAGATTAPTHLARALVYLAEEQEPEALEEAVLPVLETLDAETAPLVTAMLRVLTGAGHYDDVTTYIELSLDTLLEHGQAAELWNMLRPALVADPAAASLRAAALTALRAIHADQPRFEHIITTAGLANVAASFKDALELYERIIQFPPGGHVEHTSWGIGEILEHDGETLMLRFASRPTHEMQRRLAESALECRDVDDLRVLTALHPERLAEMREQETSALVAAALKALGGEAKPRDLRRLLTAAAIETEQWPAWWKRARAALEEDVRFDLSETFRDVYRLIKTGAGAEAVSLPRMNDRDDPVRQIRMLRRFQEQHPDMREQLVQAHARRLERWLAKRRMTMAQRLLVRIVLTDWLPEHRGKLVEELIKVCDDGFDLSELTDVRDQELLLDLGFGEANWQPIALAGLSSRVPPIRECARAVIEERLTLEEAAELYGRVLRESPRRGDAVLEVVTMVLDGTSPALAHISAVSLFLKLLALVSEPEREALRNRARKLLTPSGPIFTRLRAVEPVPAEIERVAMGLLAFRASDQFLNPILDSIEDCWGPAALESLRRRRRQESERIAARMEDDSGFPTVLYMTRSSYETLQAEVDRVQIELRTTIPRSIQRAREFGDLSENAEYDAAKLKQQQYNDRLERLTAQFTEAAIIEDAGADGATVSVGTEVALTLTASGEEIIYWVLGYDDSGHGSNVVSFQSEVGRALWRRRVGDEFDLPGADGPSPARVERITVKLPAGGSGSSESD